MPDPSDRIRAEPTARSRSRAAPAPPRRSWIAKLKPTSKRSVAGAALGAVMIGIVVNAVALQHGRRIEPAPLPPATAAVQPPTTAAVRPPAAAPAQTASRAAPEPPRPSPSPEAMALAHAAKPADPIADFLRNQGADKRRMTLAAQSALARLGFAVKATGALDAPTRDALAEFEKSHRLPVSTEITARLIKSLNAAVTSN